MARLSVRAAQTLDAPAMAWIAAESHARSWSEEAINWALAQPGAIALVAAEAHREPRGFILVHPIGEDCEILYLAVERTARRQGLARRLLCEALLAADQAQSMLLEVAVSNAGARALYEEIGFVEIGRRKGYYAGDPPEDALVLKRPLKLSG